MSVMPDTPWRDKTPLQKAAVLQVGGDGQAGVQQQASFWDRFSEEWMRQLRMGVQDQFDMPPPPRPPSSTFKPAAPMPNLGPHPTSRRPVYGEI